MSLRSLHQSRPSHLRRYGSLPLLFVGAALLGFLAQFQWVGDIVIVLFAGMVIMKQISSRFVFVVALWTLGVVPIAVIFSNWAVAQNFAAYSFLLMVFGVIMTTVELKREPQSRE